MRFYHPLLDQGVDPNDHDDYGDEQERDPFDAASREADWIQDTKDQIESAPLAQAGLAVMKIVNFALKTQHDEQFALEVKGCVKAFWARCQRELKSEY